MEQSIVLQQLSAAARALNAECGWQLTPVELRSYAEALRRHYVTSGRRSEVNLRQMLLNYHEDHAVVAALCDQLHANHQTVWDKMCREIRTTLMRFTRTQRVSLPLGCIEDLIQDASQAIWCGLEQFHYQSRLSTWQHQVVVNCVTHSYRAGAAQRRGGGTSPQSLDALADHAQPQLDLPDAALPDERALHSDLRSVIATALSAAHDARLQLIFELNVYDEYTLREIGSRLNLSAARVSGLLQRARSMLSANPAVCAWFDKELVS